MKKNIVKLLSLAAASTFMFSSCIEEVIPESSQATSEQIGASATALEAAVNGMPSQMVQGYLVYGKQTHETDLAYPSLMLAQTQLLGDIVAQDYGYDWWWPFSANLQMADNSYASFLPYFTLYKFIKSANDVIAAVDVTDPSISSDMRGYGGMAHAFRAFNYYNLMVLFEPMENIYTDCSKVMGLTVPKVTEETTNDIAKNNPRLPHDEMVKFILEDLAKAEIGLEDFTPATKNFPSLAVVYGLMAKVHLWDKNYAEAAKFARKAIETSGATPMTQQEWLDPTTGFNTATSAWMWYLHPTEANMGNLANFTGHISSEADWGYSSLSKLQIARNLYDMIPKTDFRKYAFLDPDRSFYNYESVKGQDWLDEQPDYLSLKFRCAGGDYKTFQAGAAVDIPVMRVEEMYLIEAEAVGASQGLDAGKKLLTDFMKQYRQKDYNCLSPSLEAFQLEVLKQMRIEFWGEGVAFPTAKRLKPDVIQNYEGTNYKEDILKINCKGGKPNWTLVIPKDEVDSNVALQGMNNPDPSGAIPVRPTPIGEFAPGN